jgi:hypothetical protein
VQWLHNLQQEFLLSVVAEGLIEGHANWQNSVYHVCQQLQETLLSLVHQLLQLQPISQMQGRANEPPIRVL